MVHKVDLVHQFLEASSALYPEKTALVHDGVRTPYTEIDCMANRLARWLFSQGVRKGDRVPMILMNSLEYVVSYFGIMKAGAIAVPLGTDLRHQGFSPLLAELESTVCISSGRFEKLLTETPLNEYGIKNLLMSGTREGFSLPSVEVMPWDSVINEGEVSPLSVSISSSDLASFIYTSGSTGKPKGVMLSHGNIVANVNSICKYLKLDNRDIQMVVLPFFYVMGISLLNTHFAVGGSVVINNKFAYPATVINQLIEEKCTGFSGVPSTYAYLLHRSPLTDSRDKLQNLRYCSQAGGHMARQVKEELRRVLPEHTEIFIMYGATEASARLTYLDPSFYNSKMNSIGKAIPGVVMKVLDEGGLELSPGETGELVGSGPNIMQGYFKDPEGTAKVLDHNGYHTGDMGYMDEDGFFYLVGRKDNLMKVGGHRINPQEVEDCILSTGLIVEAAVVGLPDEMQENRLVAVVAPIEKDTTEEQVMAVLFGKLPRFKLPSEIRFVRQLPKKVNGKIDKFKCKEMFDK